MEKLKFIPGAVDDDGAISKGWPVVLTIAGLDPTGGAGILADIKTFEQNAVYGLAIATANTLQTDQLFVEQSWSETGFLIRSIKTLSERFAIAAVKIGILPSLDVLEDLIAALANYLPNAAVVWDPVFSASAGATFFQDIKAGLPDGEKQRWRDVLTKMRLITPNRPEAAALAAMLIEPDIIDATAGNILNEMDNATACSNQLVASMRALSIQSGLSILLKGGHLTQHKGTDLLIIYSDSKHAGAAKNRVRKKPLVKPVLHTLVPHMASKGGFGIAGQVDNECAKHGSGCVLSSAIIARLAYGDSLLAACTAAKIYTTGFLYSNTTLLGHHANRKLGYALNPHIY
ncbi:MAG TPA: bifunctional hydroxymethylpyrimidine kinase/phosphomethylpyrimidine kinase [Arachidicoccus sp.]|nr:bifunctional hydroxymethylpyrimidine kinase/phosphomethylpyrimidine kinase [Arachidicoccus sp.]